MRLKSYISFIFFFIFEVQSKRSRRRGLSRRNFRASPIIRNERGFFSSINRNNRIYFSSALPNSNQPLLIPKIFHSVWFDFGKGKEIPQRYVENRRKLMELHPDWTIMEWDEEKVVDLIKSRYPFFLKTFLSYDKPIKKHDSCRAVILHAFGGVYVDHDFYPLRNIEPILKSFEFVAGNERISWFEPSNGLMACTKHHNLMYKYMEFMNVSGIPKRTVLEATGPFMLRKVIENYVRLNGNNKIKVYDISFFYNCSTDVPKDSNVSDEYLKRKYPNCIFMHGYDYTWKNQ